MAECRVDPIAWLVVGDALVVLAVVGHRPRAAPEARQPARQLEGGGGSLSRHRRRVRRRLASVRRGGATPTGRRRSRCRLPRRRPATRVACEDGRIVIDVDGLTGDRSAGPAVALVVDRRLRPDLRDRLGDADRAGARVRDPLTRASALDRDLLAVADDLRVVARQLEDALHRDRAGDGERRRRAHSGAVAASLQHDQADEDRDDRVDDGEARDHEVRRTDEYAVCTKYAPMRRRDDAARRGRAA